MHNYLSSLESFLFNIKIFTTYDYAIIKISPSFMKIMFRNNYVHEIFTVEQLKLKQNF